MRLTTREMELFEAACADHRNDAAQELLNVFAAERAVDVLLHLPTVPLGLLADLASHLWRAVNHEHRKRTGSDLVFLDNSIA
ncbi:MAG TPA: hypothetical protein VGS96_20455 [Thermoanaerobaculia bacterium]|jgi:hypothetical protein|nr:hypothetical protein [Thermoanaerobaculia bacterium]